jgi:ElaB/YqjD/DUF883 family membrane-anchored ribosome-binding protein
MLRKSVLAPFAPPREKDMKMANETEALRKDIEQLRASLEKLTKDVGDLSQSWTNDMKARAGQTAETLRDSARNLAERSVARARTRPKWSKRRCATGHPKPGGGFRRRASARPASAALTAPTADPAMNAMMWVGLLGSTIDRMRASVRQKISGAIVIAGGGVVLVCAIGFALAAAHMWLALRMPNYMAALVIAGGLAVIGLIVVAIGRARSNAPARRVDVEARAERAAGKAREEALSATTSHPPSALLTALILGLVAGLLGPRRRH